MSIIIVGTIGHTDYDSNDLAEFVVVTGTPTMPLPNIEPMIALEKEQLRCDVWRKQNKMPKKSQAKVRKQRRRNKK